MEEGAAADTAADGGSKQVQVKVSDTALDRGLEGEWAQTNLRSAGGSPIGREDGGSIQPPMRCQCNMLSRTQVNINTCNLPRYCSLPSGLTALSSRCKASQLT